MTNSPETLANTLVKDPIFGRGRGALRWSVYLLLASYVAATMRDLPGPAYALKWLALAVLGGTALVLARDHLRLNGMPIISTFAPWLVMALAYQVLIGPTGRGIGVAGGSFGLVVFTFLILPSAITTLDELDRFERWCIQALAALCAAAIFLGLRDLTGSIVPNAQDRLRIRWAFEHVNTGGYLGYLGLVLSLRQILVRRWRFAVPGIVFAFTLVTSGSRGALAGLVIALSVVALLELSRRRGSGYAILTLFPPVAVLLSLFTISLTALTSGFSLLRLNQVTSGRLGAWKAAVSRLDGWVDWVFGQGAGQNVNYVGTKASVGGSSDNFVVDLLTRSGVVGLLIWLGTVAIILLLLARRYRQLSGSSSRHRLHAAFVVGLGLSAVCAAGYEGFVFSVGSAYAVVVWASVGVVCLHETAEPDVSLPASNP